MSQGHDRRSFFKLVSTAGVATLIGTARTAWAIDRIENPLRTYPKRDWERAYRELYQNDSEFVFTCAPNDTHNCHLKALVKNGVVVRIMPTYNYGEAQDLDGNRASHRWDPRCCNKGLALTRRFYGDRRVRYPMVRAGLQASGSSRAFPRTRTARWPRSSCAAGTTRSSAYRGTRPPIWWRRS